MKAVKIILAFGLLASIEVGCSNSLSPTSKNGISPLNEGQNGTAVGALDTLWTIVSNPNLTENQKRQLSKINARYKGGSIKLRTQSFARLNKNALSMLQVGHKIALPLSVDSTVVAVGKRIFKPNGDNGNTFWEGPLLNFGGDLWAVLSIDPKGQVGGDLEPPPGPLVDFVPSTIFSPIGGNLVVIQQREVGQN
jgi:hypothetical protein